MRSAHRSSSRASKRCPAHGFERQRAVVAERGRLDHLLAELGQHRQRSRALAAPPGGQRGQREFFAEQFARERRQKPEQRGRLEKRRPRCVGHHDVARAHRLQQPRHAERGVGAQFQRVQVFVIDALDQAVHRLQAAQRLQVKPLIAHGQVTAFDQQQAEITREVRVFERGFAVRAWGEQHDLRVVRAAAAALRAQTLQVIGERAVGGRQMLHRQRIERARKQARDGQPVFQQITEARWRLGALRHHAPAAVHRARQVERGDLQVHVAGEFNAVHRAQVTGLALHQRRRQQRALQQRARSVNVGQHAVEQAHTLQHPGFDRAPVGCLDDQRKQVERPRPLRLGGVGQRVVGHAVVGQLALQLAHARVHPDAAAGVAEPVDEALPARGQRGRVALGSSAAAQLVEMPGRRRRCLLPDRANRRRLDGPRHRCSRWGGHDRCHRTHDTWSLRSSGDRPTCAPGGAVRRSSVNGNSRLAASAIDGRAASSRPGVWPMREKRAMRRLSAS